MSPRVDPLLPLYSQKPFPFVKLMRKYFALIIITLLLMLSLMCYVFIPQIRVSTNFMPMGWQTIPAPDSSHTTSSSIANGNFGQHLVNSDTNAVIEQTNGDNNVVNVIRRRVPANSEPLVLPSGADPNATVREQRDFVKDMMRESWDNYVKYAWGLNELKPESLKGHSSSIFGGDTRLGATIVDALDTLYIMNMTDEFNAGREWVANNLTFSDVNSSVSVFETVIRFVGGLLASYALTKDPMFLEKARHVTDQMLPAFNTQTGLPHALINPMTHQSNNYGWASGGASILSEVGTLHLEFVYLSYATGDQKYKEKVVKIRDFLDKMTKPNGLYIIYINPYNGEWGEDRISVGALGDSYFEYLIKSWIQTNGTDQMARRMYDSAVEAIDRHLVQRSNQTGLTYLAKMTFGKLEHMMEHLTCFTGGMFALGAQNLTDLDKKQHFMQLGANITDMCAQTYLRTATQLGPEAFHFTEQYEAVAMSHHELHYILRPEVIESYFYLWRLTHDQRFRDYAWSAAQAIGQHCRTGSGFSGISNVNDTQSAKDDVQQSFFLAETLKYLYLIFSSDDLISLNEWVFNTEGHPLPILSGPTSQPSRPSHLQPLK